MSGEAKPFPLTETKYAQLRREGIVPMSAQLLTLGALIGVLGGVVWLRLQELWSFDTIRGLYRHAYSDESQVLGGLENAVAGGCFLVHPCTVSGIC